MWTKYFTKNHQVYLFSEKENYLSNKPFTDVEIIFSNGFFGGILNFFKFNSHKLFQLNKLLSVYLYAKKINRVVDEKNIDIVHAHNLYQGFIASFIYENIPVVFTPMGSDVIIHAQKNFIYKYMAKKAFKRADIVTNDSEILRERGYLVGAKKDNSFIIQNGVDGKIFYPKGNNIKEKYNIEDNEILLFSPRGLDKIYNIDLILHSVALLKRLGCKIKCMISYGFGEENLANLKNIIKEENITENIIWIGSLEYDDMPTYYNAADIVISIPSSDSSPKSVYEAMFCQKSVIVSDLDWVYEKLDNENCILKVDLNSISIAEGVTSLINDIDLRSSLAKNARKVSTKYYDYESNMKKMEQLMLDLLKTKAI